MTNEIIKERIDLLEPNYKQYILSNAIPDIAQGFITKQNFDEDTSTAFENGIVILMLFFINKDGFSDYLVSNCGIKSYYEASLLTEAIILSLPDDVKKTFEYTSNLVFKDDLTITTDADEVKQEIISPIDLNEEIKETEAVLNTLNPIRTMSGDNDLFKQEKVHSSSQFDLFGLMGKRKEETEKTSPKWDTDN